jgi:hypothetical protein
VGADGAPADAWSSFGAGVAFRARHQELAGDPATVEDVGPFESVDFGPAEAGVEGDRVGEGVLGLERGEQLRGLVGEGDPEAWSSVVRWELDEPERPARWGKYSGGADIQRCQPSLVSRARAGVVDALAVGFAARVALGFGQALTGRRWDMRDLPARRPRGPPSTSPCGDVLGGSCFGPRGASLSSPVPRRPPAGSECGSCGS